MSSKKHIAFIVPYPVGKAPSQRFRVENFLPLLDAAGMPYRLYPFMDDKTWNVLYKQGSPLQKVTGILKGFLKRWKHVLWDIRNAEAVFVHREAAPLGPPLFEWIIAKLWHKRMIYDFDDAIWIPNTSSENVLVAAMKANWKVQRICRYATVVTGGNDYLCAYAQAHTRGAVVKVPTVVDTVSRYNILKDHTDVKEVTVGWTGSHSTLKYLESIAPVLADMQRRQKFTFLVIADKKPELNLPYFEFVPWSATAEIPDLLRIDIGLMPLTADAWSEGKCGFKLIQYLSLGIPALASPIGVNTVIVEEGVNGFLCADTETWRMRLEQLVADSKLRSTLGSNGRKKMIAEYSITSQQQVFLDLFPKQQDF